VDGEFRIVLTYDDIVDVVPGKDLGAHGGKAEAKIRGVKRAISSDGSNRRQRLGR
jgi:hypothetical protein